MNFNKFNTNVAFKIAEKKVYVSGMDGLRKISVYDAIEGKMREIDIISLLQLLKDCLFGTEIIL